MSGKNKEWKETVTYKTTQPQLNDFVCNSLSGTHTYLTFKITFQSNDLTYHQSYSKKQQVIYELIRMLHEEKGLGYRKISYKLNTWGIKTHRGNEWLPQSVFSVLKKKFQRDSRILNQRTTLYPTEVSQFKLETYPND